jgi:CDP-glucose 4,6-dehydratase
VLEPLSGYLLLAEKLYEDGQVFAEAWNFGPPNEDARSVRYIVEQLCILWGQNAKWLIQSGENPHEANYLKLDISKAKQSLNWAPRWSLDRALIQIIDWHQAWRGGQNMHAFCINQINQYQK